MAAEPETWRVLGASVRGSSHVQRGVECQDAHAIRMLGDSRFVLAVADGAGSAKHSAEGASTAAAAVADYIAHRLSETSPENEADCAEILRSAHAHASARLEALADGDRALSDFATTLLICFVDGPWLGVASIGDGAIVLNACDNLVLLQPDCKGEYLNETDFVTSAAGTERMLVDVRTSARVTGIAMFTDGVEWAAIQYKEHLPHARFFEPLFKQAADAGASDIDEFLSSQRFCEQTDDDKTLVLAVKI